MFYRYDSITFEGGRVELVKEAYYLLKETPCGYWIHSRPYYNKEYELGRKPKWISKTSRKRFAYPTEEEALRGLIMRKRRQVEVLHYKLDDAYEVWDLALQKLRELTGAIETHLASDNPLRLFV